MSLKFKRVAPKSGIARSAVFFIHGYGADGADLISIGDLLSQELKDTVFFAPDAPEKCGGSPFGFQWFPIPWIDGSSEVNAKAKLADVSMSLNRWIDSTLENEGVKIENSFLFGFSQGTMLSLHIAPTRKRSFGGVIGFSGRLVDTKHFSSSIVSCPPVILIHGAEDEVINCSYMNETSAALIKLGFNVKTHLCSGLGHGISPEGLGFALSFLKERLLK